MEILSHLSHYGLWFLVLLTALVFVHEMGHFLVARWCGVRVEVFSIGFGPELFGWTDKHQTRWRFSLLPLGGYVRMFGSADMMLEGKPGEAISEKEKAVSFVHKSAAQRIAVTAAGPIANYLFAFVVLAALYASTGKIYSSPVIGEVVPDSAAANAGLMSGDKILAIDGRSIERFEDVASLIQLGLDKPLLMSIERNGVTQNISVQPKVVEESDIFGNVQRIGRLGVRSSGPGQMVRLSPLESVHAAGAEIVQMTANILTGISQIVTGARSSSELGGILRIAKMSGDVASLGWVSLVGLAVLLSVNLGLLNLFPIPLLDGGQIVFYLIEILRGKPLGERAQEWGMRVGLAALMGLMLFATWNDLAYLKIVDYIRALFT